MTRQILLFLDSSTFGGIESHVKALATMLCKYCQVKVVLWRRYDDEHLLEHQLAKLDIQTEVLDGSVRKLASLLTSLPDTVLHCHGYKANVIGRFVALVYRVRCVCTFHNGDIGEGLLRFYTWLDETTSVLSRNIAVSHAIGRRVKGPCTVLANSVALPKRWLSKETQKGVVAFVGRIEQVKRPDRFCSLANHFTQQPFAVWGDGSLRPALTHKSSHNITWHGQVESMEPFWKQVDILIICSEYEGFPMVALEAMASGVPVLTLPLGDLPTLIRHKVSGFIADDEAQMQHYLDSWFNLTNAERQTMRQAARQQVEQHFNLDKLWPRLAELYA